MTDSVVIVGAGGFGREVIDVVDAISAVSGTPPYRVIGVVDDNPTNQNLDRLRARGVRFLGAVDELLASAEPAFYSVGIGSPAVRQRIAARFDSAGWHGATLVHPAATTGFGVSFGAGSVVCAGVRLTNNIQVGQHVHLNLNATVGHDSVIGDFVSINPLASISGDVAIGDYALIGVAGVILQGRTIGSGAVVGGSACVVTDVETGVTVTGVPARVRDEKVQR